MKAVTRLRCGPEIVEAVLDDKKVNAALEDAIYAIVAFGPESVDLEHLKSVLAWRADAIQNEEIEVEAMEAI